MVAFVVGEDPGNTLPLCNVSLIVSAITAKSTECLSVRFIPAITLLNALPRSIPRPEDRSRRTTPTAAAASRAATRRRTREEEDAPRCGEKLEAADDEIEGLKPNRPARGS